MSRARAAWQRVTDRPRPLLVGELIVVLILVRVYDYVRSLAHARRDAALDHGLDLLALERHIFLDWELPANRWLARYESLSFVVSFWYQFAHLSVTLSLLAWVYVRRVEAYRAARNALVLTNVVGLIVFATYPVMPPRLMPDLGYVDSVAEAGLGTSPAGPVPADAYAAMPSLHFGWAVWVGIVGIAVTLGRRRRWLWLVPPTLTGIAVVLTANHWVIDLVAGLAVALVATWVSGSLPSGRARRQMMRRRTSTPSTQAPGSSGAHTVNSRYAITAASAVGAGTPTPTRPADSATSRAPKPPGDGSSELNADAAR